MTAPTPKVGLREALIKELRGWSVSFSGDVADALLKYTLADLLAQRDAAEARALAAEGEVMNKDKALKSAEHMLALRTRQLKMCGDYWCQAAEKALAGDLSELYDRVQLRKTPKDWTIVQSGALPVPETQEVSNGE